MAALVVALWLEAAGPVAAPPPAPPPLDPRFPHAAILYDGTRVEGKVLEKDGESIYMATEDGVRRIRIATLDLPRSRIPPIEEVPHLSDAYARHRLAADPKDAEDNARLGAWLLRRGEWRMDPEQGSGHWEGMRLLDRVLEPLTDAEGRVRDPALGPDNDTARDTLGYRKEEAGPKSWWTSLEERRFIHHQRQSGFLPFQGKWISENEQARLQDPPVPVENEQEPGLRSVWDLERTFGTEAPLGRSPEERTRQEGALKTLWTERYRGKPVAWRGWIDSIVAARSTPNRVPGVALSAISRASKPGDPADEQEWREQTGDDAEGIWVFQVKFVKSGGWDPAKVPGGLWRHDRAWVLLTVRGGPGKRLDGFREGDPIAFVGRLTSFAREAGRVFFSVDADAFDLHREFIRPPILDPMAPRHPEVPADPANPEFPKTPKEPRRIEGASVHFDAPPVAPAP